MASAVSIAVYFACSPDWMSASRVVQSSIWLFNWLVWLLRPVIAWVIVPLAGSTALVAIVLTLPANALSALFVAAGSVL